MVYLPTLPGPKTSCDLIIALICTRLSRSSRSSHLSNAFQNGVKSPKRWVLGASENRSPWLISCKLSAPTGDPLRFCQCLRDGTSLYDEDFVERFLSTPAGCEREELQFLCLRKPHKSPTPFCFCGSGEEEVYVYWCFLSVKYVREISHTHLKWSKARDQKQVIS